MNNNERLDYFASFALQALISKMPFYDVKGELGKEINQEELSTIKKDLTETAYEYAQYMLLARRKPLAWVKENETAL